MSRLSFAEALAEYDKKQQPQPQQTTTPAQQQVVAGQIGGGSTADTSQATTVPGIKPQPAYKDIKDKTKANEANKQIAQTTAGNNSDEPSPVDMGTGTRRFNHGSNETPRTPEEQAKIDAHDREVEQMGYSDPSDDTDYSADNVYGQGAGTYGSGAYGYPGYGYGYPDVQTLDDVTNALMPYHVPNSEELKKEQKRERRDMLIRSLGDGISAIAGLTTAINGGPNIVNPDASLAKSGREMYDKLREQRRKDYTAYLNAALKKEQASAAKLRAMSAAERSKFTAETARMKAESAIRVAEGKLEVAEGKAAADKAYKEAIAEIRRQHEEAYKKWVDGKLTIEQYKAETQRLKAHETAVKSAAGKKGVSTSVSDSTKTVIGNDGEVQSTTNQHTVKQGGKTTTTTTVTKGPQKPAAGGSGSGGGKPASGSGSKKPQAPSWTKK
jgi:hypothetical protein